MIELNQLKPFKFDYAQLDSVALYYWMVEYVLNNLKSEKYSIEILDDNGYGAHWGGFFVILNNKSGDESVFCHMGMVFHPDLITGIYFEAEEIKNPDTFNKLWEGIKPDPDYDLSKDEPSYIKMFFPEKKLSQLMSATTVDEQINMLTKYFDACFAGMLNAAI